MALDQGTRKGDKTLSGAFRIMPTRRHQDLWLCLNAHNRHAWALRETGRRYWQGDNVARQDKVLGYMWYSIEPFDAEADPAQVSERNELKRSLAPAELRKARQLAASWNPDKTLCVAPPRLVRG